MTINLWRNWRFFWPCGSLDFTILNSFLLSLILLRSLFETIICFTYRNSGSRLCLSNFSYPSPFLFKHIHFPFWMYYLTFWVNAKGYFMLFVFVNLTVWNNKWNWRPIKIETSLGVFILVLLALLEKPFYFLGCFFFILF